MKPLSEREQLLLLPQLSPMGDFKNPTYTMQLRVGHSFCSFFNPAILLFDYQLIEPESLRLLLFFYYVMKQYAGVKPL